MLVSLIFLRTIVYTLPRKYHYSQTRSIFDFLLLGITLRSICSGKVRVISDYIPICLDIVPLEWGLFPFKFYKFWILFDGFDSLVKNCVSSFSSYAGPIDRLSHKLKVNKLAIKGWIPSRRANRNTRLIEIESLIQDMDIQAESLSIPIDVWHRKQELRKEHYKILLEQEIYWKQ